MRRFLEKNTYTSEISLLCIAVRWLLANTSAGSSDLEWRKKKFPFAACFSFTCHVHIEVHISGRLGESFHQLPTGGVCWQSAPKLRTPTSSTKNCTAAFFLGDRLSPFFLNVGGCVCVSVEFLLGAGWCWRTRAPLP